MTTERDLFSAYCGLLGLAITAIYTGSRQSLPHRHPKYKRTKRESDDSESDDEIEGERMTSEDAWIMPIVGSITLFGLYLVIKYFGTDVLNVLLGAYMSIAGVGSVWQCSVSIAKYVLGRPRWRTYGKYTISISKGSSKLGSLSARTPTLVLAPLGALPSLAYKFTTGGSRSALLTDILAFSFCFNALSLLKIDTFATGIILLSGLFVYDVWWVFGTEVMVKVATQLDLPMKLLWPKSVTLSTANGFTMLGLGDVVIPGLFISLALRYDFYRSEAQMSAVSGFKKPYFYATLAAYLAGLVTTMGVMHVFQSPQPALLYLSPACILSFAATAIVRGEFWDAWRWSDSLEQDKKDE